MTAVRHRSRGVAPLLASSFFFATSGPLAKAAMDVGLKPGQVTTARIGIAAVVLLVAFGIFRPAALRVRRGEWRLLLGYGVLGVAGTQLLYFVAVSRLPVGVALLLEYLSPVLVTLYVRFVRGVRLARLAWGGTALALIGLVLVAQVWQGLRLDSLGVLAGLATAVCSAGYFLIGEHGAASREPFGMVVWGMAIGTVVVSLVAPPWTLASPVLGAEAHLGPWHSPTWTLLVAVALLSTVFAFLFGISALRHLPSAVASVLALTEPVISIVLAWLLLGEALTAVQLAGAAVLLSGAVVVQLTSRTERVVDPVDPYPGAGTTESHGSAR
jgi:drug/metabolite transporter (DMT)-like permease